MIALCHKIHRHITIVLLTLLCIMQISVPIYQVKAQIAVKDLLLVGTVTAQTAANAANTTAITGAITSTAAAAEAAENTRETARQLANTAREAKTFLEKYVIEPGIRAAMMIFIRTLTDQTVAWIREDNGRNVGFVKNLEQNAKSELDARAAEVLNHIAKINLCSVDLHRLLRLQLSQPGFEHLNTQLQCTLTKLVANVESFYQDFNNGGWPAFIGIAVDSQNNYVGASLIAQLNYQNAVNAATQASEKRISLGSGFEGVTFKKESEVCDEDEDDPDPLSQTGVIPGHCYIQTDISTPGELVSNALDEAVNRTGVNLGIAHSTAIANAVDAAIQTIIGALVERIMKEATTLF